MYPLQISMVVNELNFEHLAVILAFLAFITGFIFYNGITFKLGDKSVDIGGLKKTFVNNSADVFLKERLKKQIDEIDEEMGADLLDLVDAMNTQFERILLGKHCWFTLDKFVGLIKKELIRRVRRNNLKVKLCGINKEKYIRQMMTQVKEEYKVLQLKAADAKCADLYTDFSLIEEAVRIVIGAFFDETKRIVMSRIESKIKLYETTKGEFKTAELRKQACETPLAKNRDYIEHLQETAG